MTNFQQNFKKRKIMHHRMENEENFYHKMETCWKYAACFGQVPDTSMKRKMSPLFRLIKKNVEKIDFEKV